VAAHVEGQTVVVVAQGAGVMGATLHILLVQVPMAHPVASFVQEPPAAGGL